MRKSTGDAATYPPHAAPFGPRVFSTPWKALMLGMQLMFGLHGAFSYLGAALAGAAVGVHLHVHDGPTRWLIGVGAGLCACAGAVGLAATYSLRRVREGEEGLRLVAADSFERSASHSRLLWGAADMGIILYFLGAIEMWPHRVPTWERVTRAYRRLGHMSLTIYAWHTPMSRLVWIPFARYATSANIPFKGVQIAANRAAEGRPEVDPARDSVAGDTLLLAYLLAVPLAWMLLFALWSRLHYVGSLEWVLAKLLGGLGGGRARAQTLAERPLASGHGSSTDGAGESRAADPAPGREGSPATPSTESAVSAQPSRRYADGAAIAIHLLTITWVPASAWWVLSTQWLAPTLEDYYHKNNASNILTGAPADVEDPQKAQLPGRVNLNLECFIAFYALPVLACSLVVLLESICRRQRGRGQPGGATDSKLKAA
jgi:hypothetical protein